MRIRLYNNGEADRWDQYVMRAGSSCCYHLIGWKDVIEKSFGQKTYYLLAEGENGIQGILPLIQLKSYLFGNFMVSLPYFNYGGICADDDEASRRLLEEAENLAIANKVDHVELRHVQQSGHGLPVKRAKVSMRLRLPEKGEDLWNSFPSKLRSQLRKPTKEGLYVEFGGEEQLESFYAVFSMNMRDLGTPVYPRGFFQGILRRFPHTTWICTVYTKDAHPVASGFLVGFKETLEIPWASSLRDYNHLSPNMLLYWSILKFACEKGYEVFDFGRSTPGEGTYKFKEQWGATPVQLHWYYWLRNGGPLPDLNPDNPRYRLAIRIWQRLPLAVTKLFGPHIVKNLP